MVNFTPTQAQTPHRATRYNLPLALDTKQRVHSMPALMWILCLSSLAVLLLLAHVGRVDFVLDRSRFLSQPWASPADTPHETGGSREAPRRSSWTQGHASQLGSPEGSYRPANRAIIRDPTASGPAPQIKYPLPRGTNPQVYYPSFGTTPSPSP